MVSQFCPMNEVLTAEKPEVNIDFNRLVKPFFIAGPCSAETEDQVLETARSLARFPEIQLFRAGIWKPRTRPNAFEGHGARALPWLVKVKAETGLAVCTEVARATHTEEALKAGIDVLWIGARTTVNPFSVQEIAEVLRGVDIPVMIKNPVTPDLQLWIGAVERLQNVGIHNIAVIHRGFSSYQKTKFRNAPEWSIPIDFKRLFPRIPMLCDPSHIAGNRPLLFPIAQKAFDLDYSGLMIETHPRPNEAWSDAQQQITPAALHQLIQKINYRHNQDSEEAIDELEQFRRQIDGIDVRLLEVLAERMAVVRQIGAHKKENGMTLLQINRWSEVYENQLRNGLSLGLSEQMIHDLYKLIHLESIQTQERIIRGSNEV